MLFLILAWDQSGKFMKIYATANGVQSIPSENVTCEYTEKCVHFVLYSFQFI